MSFKYSARMLKYLLVLVSVQLFNVVDGDAVGGIFRYGHIRWSSTQNTVNFVVEAAFQRSVKNSYFVGTAPDGFAQVEPKLAPLRSFLSSLYRRETL
mmetsp:Transcript_19244/g.53256  ORF Transcript_19244/g.53256 Transcript_19244/m.53256 type:complete len:97 (+) Transcript_19244:88-378(+)